MFKSILAGVVLAFGVSASANTIFDDLVNLQQQAIQSQVGIQELTWQVGDSANYNINMGFISGTMVMKVSSVTADGIWMDQDMDLGMMGQQKVQTLIDKNTGAIKKMIVNGQEQQPPAQDIEVVSTNQEKVTVPAGTFDSMHVVARDKNQSGDINVWMNPLIVPMSGMLKQVAPGQLGEVTVECTAFHKQ
jgi:hypothetical protein